MYKCTCVLFFRSDNAIHGKSHTYYIVTVDLPEPTHIILHFVNILVTVARRQALYSITAYAHTNLVFCSNSQILMLCNHRRGHRHRCLDVASLPFTNMQYLRSEMQYRNRVTALCAANARARQANNNCADVRTCDALSVPRLCDYTLGACVPETTGEYVNISE